MANRNFLSKFQYSFRGMPVKLDALYSIGASGAPTLIGKAPAIQSITRLSVGVYRVQFQDSYNGFISSNVMFEAPPTGSAVAGGAFVTSTIYQIITLGSTSQAQWVAAGLPSNLTAAVGQVFKAAGAGAGTGTVQAVSNSGIVRIETIGVPPSMLASNAPQNNNGGYVVFQCLAPTSSSVTTLVPADPANGSRMRINFTLNNSSVVA